MPEVGKIEPTAKEKSAAIKAKVEAAAAKKRKAEEAKLAAKAKEEAKKKAAKEKAEAKKKAAKEKAAAKKLAAKEKAEAAKKAKLDAKAKLEAGKAAAKAEAETRLEGIAKEINHRIEQAETLDGKADDHRLAAALQLVQGEKIAKDAGIAFKEWCAEHVKWKPETIRKMLPVAKAKDPIKALADLRAGVAKRMKKSRDKAATVSRDTTPAAALQALPPAEQLETIKKAAEDLGMAVVSETQAKSQGDAAAFDGYEAMVAGFNALKGADKLKFARYCADQIGGTLTLPDFAAVS